jgi:cation diffusion facilitator family transporter
MTNAAQYQRSVRRVLIGIMVLNLIVTAIKFFVGALTGSIAVLADAFNALVDSSSNVIGLLGIHAASQPPNPDHPYGHRKYETIATLGIAGLMLLVGWEVLRDIVDRLRGGAIPTLSIESLVLILLTLPLNMFIVSYEGRRGRELGSDVLVADATGTRVNIFVSLSALIGLIGSQFGLPWLDVVVALGIVIYVVRTAGRILRETSDVLTDSVVADPHLVEDVARGVPGVWNASQVRSRGRDDDVHLDLNIKVDPAMATEQAHAIASEVERQLKEQVPGLVDAVVHIEPGSQAPLSEWDAIAVRLRAIADGLGLGVHNIHVNVVPEGYSVDIDVEVNAAFSLFTSHDLVSQFEARARIELPRLREIFTHIEPMLPGTLVVPMTGPEAGALRATIMRIGDEVCGPGASHNVMLRRSRTSNAIDASLHCSLPGDSAVVAAHLVAEQLERRLRTELPLLDHITIHVEPPGAKDE